MKRAMIGVGAGVVLVGLVVTLAARHEFSPPEHFPVLEPGEIESDPATADTPEVATFGSGCFWCTEAIFRQVKGVQSAVSGYSGGTTENPTYEQICWGRTGHAEVVQVTFDPKVVSYPELLEVFWRSHDPTTRNRQGDDVGTQYRSVVFYHSDRQRDLAERYKRKIDVAEVFSKPVVTEVERFTVFYLAETDHQDFYARNKQQPYCQRIIGRTLDKLRGVFGDRLQTE